MLPRDLPLILHRDRLREAHRLRQNDAHRAIAQEQRVEERSRKRNLKRLRREAQRAHRATIGAFVAFGDGLAKPQERHTTGRPEGD